MKKFLNFLLSLIVPSKMERYRDLNLLLSMALFVVCFFVCVVPSNIRAPKMYQNSKLTDCDVYKGSFDATFISENSAQQLPTFTLDNEGKISSTALVKDNDNNDISVYDLQYKLPDESIVNVKLIYNTSFAYDEASGKTDPADGFINMTEYKVSPYKLKDNGEVNKDIEPSKDMLLIFTKEYVYYLFNRGYFLELNTDNESVVKVSETSKYTYMISYEDIANDGISFTTIEKNDLVANIASYMVSATVVSVRFGNYLFAAIFVLLMPLLWVSATWLMSRRYGDLKRFREYYSICAVSFVAPSILIGILGLFIQFFDFARFAMLAQVGFYIFCVFKMNAKNNANTPQNPKKNSNEPKSVDVNFKNISDEYNNIQKPSQIE